MAYWSGPLGYLWRLDVPKPGRPPMHEEIARAAFRAGWLDFVTSKDDWISF
ncbi:MAG: hypothetical protein J0I12_11220 [Candidatus Eremiobacteraeota bacterium]|nr:hypothetical protein [Candidatus Eremiobacteraeota bacterium]